MIYGKNFIIKKIESGYFISIKKWFTEMMLQK